MTSSVSHPIYGTITYEESAMSGKRTLYVNGTKLVMKKKNEFLYEREGAEAIPVALKGSFLAGVKLVIGGETIAIVPAATWYEIVCSVLIFAFVLVWGNSVALCSIFPIVGGALGGAVSGAMAMVNLYVMKSVKNIWVKLGLWLGFLVATLAICFVLAVVFITALA